MVEGREPGVAGKGTYMIEAGEVVVVVCWLMTKSHNSILKPDSLQFEMDRLSDDDTLHAGLVVVHC